MASECKADAVIDNYDLRNANERLLRQREHEDAGLRSLETYINQWILKRTMVEHGMTVLDGEEENYHRLLTDDNVMKTADSQARCELTEAGIDVDEVLADFVSYQTVRKHLNECLGEDTSKEYTPDPDSDLDTIRALQNRLQHVSEQVINRLRKHDALSVGDPEAIVSIKTNEFRAAAEARGDDPDDALERLMLEYIRQDSTIAELFADDGDPIRSLDEYDANDSRPLGREAIESLPTDAGEPTIDPDDVIDEELPQNRDLKRHVILGIL